MCASVCPTGAISFGKYEQIVPLRRTKPVNVHVFGNQKVETKVYLMLPTDADEVLREALQNLQNTIAETDADIQFAKLPVLVVKPLHLLQLFQNLVGNALKYRSEDRPSITISAVQTNGEWKLTADCWSSDLTLGNLESDIPSGVGVKTNSPRKS